MKLPWFDISGGIMKFGSRTEPDGPSQRKRSSVTGVLIGVSSLRHSGSSAVEADRIDHRAGEDVRADLRALLQDARRRGRG